MPNQSDDLEERLLGWKHRIIKSEDKISELEGWTENFKEDMAIKLTELEEHIDSHGVVDQKLGHDMMKNREEIAELREHQRSTDILIREYEQAHNFQLNELKEDLERCNIQDGEIATVLHLKTDNIKEVLRDHIESHKLFDDRGIPITNPESLKINEFLDKQLEKLDVGSARQTDINDCEGCKFEGLKSNQLPCWICDAFDKFEPIETEKKDCTTCGNNRGYSQACSTCNYSYVNWKPKETEKKEFVPKLRSRCLQCKTEPDLIQDYENKDRWFCPQCDYEWNKEERLPDATGTKPPEPLSYTWINQEIAKSKEPREDLYFCRLCGNEITDVEHEVSKLTVEVKREKIEFWRKELLNKTDEVLKSMREVLGIE